MVYQHGLDATFLALADPTRRAILSHLAAGEMSVGDLATRFPMTLPAVRKHVHMLERAGLVRVWKEGRTRRARLNAAPMRQAVSWIERYRAFWEFQFDQLETLLAESSGGDRGSHARRVASSAPKKGGRRGRT